MELEQLGELSLAGRHRSGMQGQFDIGCLLRLESCAGVAREVRSRHPLHYSSLAPAAVTARTYYFFGQIVGYSECS